MSGLIPQEILDQVLLATDIVSLISEYVPLKKSGKDYKGLCPFHQEKTPSFMVSAEKNIFHCFGCGTGGNAFRFLTQLENLSFPEAVERLARKAGITLTRDEKSESQRAEKEQLYRINRYAAWFFAENLKRPAHAQALQYLMRRGLDSHTISTFQLGYAPNLWDSLLKFLQSKNVPLALAEKLGLIRKKDQGGYYDFFRNRVIFPIIDFDNRVLGFGGRRLGDDNSKEAKYINSAESPIYHKALSIYGLHQAKKALRDLSEVILVEGNVDLISLYQAGFENVAAPLGTALTADQIRILKRFAEKFILLFDGDLAGQKATLKAISLCFEMGIHPRVASLPKGLDPDAFIKRVNGKIEMKELLAQAPFAMEWLFFETLGKAGASPQERVAAAQKLLPYLEALPSPLEKEAYQTKLAHFLGLSENDWKAKRQTRQINAGDKKTVSLHPNFSLERILLELYVKYPNIAEQLVDEEAFLAFEDERLKSLGLALKGSLGKKGMPLNQWMSQAQTSDGELISELLLEPEKWENQEQVVQLIKDSVAKLKVRGLKNELKTITGAINLAELKKDMDEVKVWLAKKSETLKKLKGLTNS